MGVRTILGGVGAIVGGIIGGPMGAQIGWTLGGVAGSIVDPTTIKGPSIGDIAVQTSQEGGARPIVYGISPPITGNVIASSAPEIVTTSQRQGKGGPRVETESVYRTYAIGVCEGPIGGFLRVWRNNILVYDASEGGLLSVEDNALFLETARFFIGSFDQLPSPDLEAIYGVGTTPAMRGTAYVVFADENLTDTGGAIPQYQFQVGAGNIPNLIIYTENGIWEKPLDLDHVIVTVVGAGGGAGSGAYGYSAGCSGGGGGGGGGYSEGTFDSGDLSSTEVVTVGEGGAGGDPSIGNTPPYDNESPGNNGEDGGDSSFGAHVTAAGGSAGSGGATSSGGGGNGVGGSGNVSDGGDGGERGVFLGGDGAPSLRGGGGGAGGSGGVPNDRPEDAGGSGGISNTEGVEYGGSGRGGDGGASGPWNVGGPSSGQSGSGVGAGGGGGGAGQVQHGTEGWSGAPLAPSGAGGDGADGMVVVAEYFGDAVCIFLPALVQELCRRAGLESSKVDVSLLPEECVEGFVVTNQYPVAEAIRSLSQVYFFDATNYDGVIHFIPRGADTVMTISAEDFVDDETEVEERSRSDSISVPRVLNLNYYDSGARGLSTSKQTSERPGERRSIAEASIQTPVVLTTEKAAQVVDISHKLVIEESKGELRFSLPDSYLELVASDPIILQWSNKSERVVLKQVDILDGYQAYIGARDRQSAYISDVEGIPPPTPTPPPSNVVGATLIVPLDIHILRDADDNAGLTYYVAVAGILPAWNGALVEVSYDAGATYVDSQSTTTSAVIGELVDVLQDHPAEIPDETNSTIIRIDSRSSELSETDLAGMMNRVNLAAIGSPALGWELVNFANADDLGDNEWNVSYFLRGRKGSESRQHNPGEKFVLLYRAVLGFVPSSIADIGRTITFRATSFGAPTDSGTVTSFVYAGRSQIEREPAYLSAHEDGANIVASWQGVGRLGGGSAVAQGARFTGYRVRFTDGVSTITVDTASQEVTQDVSSLSSPVTVRVTQVNALTGEGPAIEVIV